MAAASTSIVVLDDDPTGVQTLAGIRVLLAWDAARVAAAIAGRPSVHLVTNTRALPAERVEALVAATARTALDGAPDAAIVLRGDSTLRGHVLEEYLGVRGVIAPGRWPVHLLVPALPSAGRVTVGGVHLSEHDGRRTPLHETEYAGDGQFAYTSARLLAWAEERSGGVFRACAGQEVPLDALRAGGPGAIVEALVELAARGAPAVLAPDAETSLDLELIADGYRSAVARGAIAIVRCAPAFAGVLSGTAAAELVAPPSGDGGVLLVCGSYVPQTTRQLARLCESTSCPYVEVDVRALAGARRSTEIARLVEETSRRLLEDRLAIVATPRTRPNGTTSLYAGERIATGLARVVAGVAPRPSVVIAKGGITSAVTLRDGVGANEAEVMGPVEPGVSRWAARWYDGTHLDYLVLPGNVGDDALLARLVDRVMRRFAPC